MPRTPVEGQPDGDVRLPSTADGHETLVPWRSFFTSAVALYLLSLFALVVVLHFWGDSIWWTVPLVFGPRWIAALPLLPMVPWALLSIRRRMPAAIAAGLFNLLLLDPEVGRLSKSTGSTESRLRIVSCNVQGIHGDLAQLSEFARRTSADVVFLQENNAGAALDRCWPADWHRREAYGFAVLSRFPIRSAEPVSPSGLPVPLALKCTLSTPAGEIQVCNIHLSTPRDALDAILADKWRAASTVRENIARRDRESKTLAESLSATDSPTIVAGDFNLTADSRIYRDHWSRFRNAFSDAGWGLGYTKHTRRFGVRIDHILASSAWQAVSCQVGPPIGSDHRPLMAELELRRP